MKRPSTPASLDSADGAMLLVAAIWAGNNVLTKSILNDRLSPYSYVALRFLIVTLLLFGWLRWRKTPLHIRREDIPQFILTGITGYAAYNLLFIVGLAHTSAFSAAIIVSLGPVFTLLIASALKLERVRPVQWLGVACAFLGTAVFVGNKLATGRPATGDALNLLAAVCFAVYGLATRPVVRSYGSQVVTAWSVLIGLAAVLPVTFPALLRQDWAHVGFRGWIAIAYAGAISMLVAYTLWGWAIERRGVGRTVPYLYLIPVITGVLAFIFLDEAPSISQVAGTLLVFVGIALARRGSAAGVRAERPASGAVRAAAPGPAGEDERATTRPHPSPGR